MLYNLCLIIPVSEVCVGLFQPSVMSVVLHCCVLTGWLALTVGCSLPLKLPVGFPEAWEENTFLQFSTCVLCQFRALALPWTVLGGKSGLPICPAPACLVTDFFPFLFFPLLLLCFLFLIHKAPKAISQPFVHERKGAASPNPKDVTNNTRN